MKTYVSKRTHNGRCRLSDAELSRVLSAHAGGQLTTLGCYDFRYGMGCMFQVALNEPEGSGVVLERRLRHRAGHKTVRSIIKAFDAQYEPTRTPGRLVKFLIRHGVA